MLVCIWNHFKVSCIEKVPYIQSQIANSIKKKKSLVPVRDNFQSNTVTGCAFHHSVFTGVTRAVAKLSRDFMDMYKQWFWL